MSNHIHMICKADELSKLSDIIRDFKKFTSKKILETVQNELESRRDWMLVIYLIKPAGIIQRIKVIRFGVRIITLLNFIQTWYWSRKLNIYIMKILYIYAISIYLSTYSI